MSPLRVAHLHWTRSSVWPRSKMRSYRWSSSGTVTETPSLTHSWMIAVSATSPFWFVVNTDNTVPVAPDGRHHRTLVTGHVSCEHAVRGHGCFRDAGRAPHLGARTPARAGPVRPAAPPRQRR